MTRYVSFLLVVVVAPTVCLAEGTTNVAMTNMVNRNMQPGQSVPIELTPEQDAELVRQGILPPLDNSAILTRTNRTETPQSQWGVVSSSQPRERGRKVADGTVVARSIDELVRLGKENVERTKRGESPLKIHLSFEFDETLLGERASSNASTEATIFFRYVNVPLRLVLNEYERLTGKKVLFESGSPPVTIKTNTALKKDEAILLIEKALDGMGMSLDPVDEKTMRVGSKFKKTQE